MFRWISVGSLGVLFVINILGVRAGYYRSGKVWFGRIMHFSGGFFTAMFWSVSNHSAAVIIGLTFLVGLLWEAGEYIFGLYKPKYMTEWRDTLEDLILDGVGAIGWTAVYFLIR